MKLIPVNRSFIIFEFEEGKFKGRQIKIQGEPIINGFSAYADSIRQWLPPHDKIPIDQKEKKEIIEQIRKKAKQLFTETNFEIY